MYAMVSESSLLPTKASTLIASSTTMQGTVAETGASIVSKSDLVYLSFPFAFPQQRQDFTQFDAMPQVTLSVTR